MTVPRLEQCVAFWYADRGVQTFVDAPRYRATEMPDGGVLQESNGPPFIDRRHTAGDIALHYAEQSEQCDGPCQGGDGPCRLAQAAFELLAYDSISEVPRRPLT